VTSPAIRVDQSTVRVVDGLVAFWVLLWLVVAASTAVTIWQLSSLGNTLTQSGEAVGSAAEALRAIGDLPLVGEGPRELADEAAATADQVIADGTTVERRLRLLAVLLGLTVFFVPVTPLVGLWLPLRLRRAREARMIKRALVDDAGAPLDRYLARRATTTLPYEAVRSAFEDGDGRLTREQERALADAELARMGLRRPATSSRT